MPNKTITEYWVGNKGSTPLWETKLTQFANGDLMQEARACVVETGEWQPVGKQVDQKEFIWLPPKEGWKNVTRQEAFKKFPICFPALLLKKINHLESCERALDKLRGDVAEACQSLGIHLTDLQPEALTLVMEACERHPATAVLSDQQYKILTAIDAWVTLFLRMKHPYTQKKMVQELAGIADKIEEAQIAHRELAQKPKILSYEYEGEII